MHTQLKKTIKKDLLARQKKGLLRTLTKSHTHTNAADIYLHLNDYLQLSKHPLIIQAAKNALVTWGTTSAGSPLVGSYLHIHQTLEEALAKWCGFQYGLLWNAGFSANKAVLSLLPQRGDVILADRYIHNSMIIGARETEAKLIRYHHLDLDHLEKLLKTYTHTNNTVFVVTESVFSMEGDYPDFKQMRYLKERFDFFWIVDEAHALGWYGPKGNGLIAAFGLENHVDVLVATLGKSLASQGAFTLFHDSDLRSYLINRSSEFIYSTYLTPAATAASLAAIDIIHARCVERQSKWLKDTLALKKCLQPFFPNLPLYDSPIVPLIVGEPLKTLHLRDQLYSEHQIVASSIRPPSVPAKTSRLRLSLHCNLNFELLATTLENFFSKHVKLK